MDLEKNDEIDEREEFDSSEFNPSEFTKEKYKVEKVEELVDSESGVLIDKSKITPMDHIRAIAKKLGNDIKDPNPSCKHCYGRGHINAIPEGSNVMPIPCRCIYTKQSKEAESKMPFTSNRKYRRQLDKSAKKIAKRYQNLLVNKAQEELKKKDEING